ncbi:hypothetical protein DH2020_036900 [Rehmannia glutinosa]|uniref:Protein kinase domain-containing protein n=1 Tax=Rehmannia glutinosa TaxID=99300 RepID=A0ABR0V2C9_REHGL
MGHCCSKGVTVSVDKDDLNSTSAAANNHRRQTPHPDRIRRPPPMGRRVRRLSRSRRVRFRALTLPASRRRLLRLGHRGGSSGGRCLRLPRRSLLCRRFETATGFAAYEADTGGSGGGGGRAEGSERPLDKSFGYSKNFAAKYELGKEVGRGHFGHTCWAKGKRGAQESTSSCKDNFKSKMTTAIAIEDVRREVKILKALSGHKNLIKFYDAFEDTHNVYVRWKIYREEDAKKIVVQMLSVVAFCHLQGVVHRDLKPENFLFATKKDEDAPMKVIDFGLSDFIRPDQRLNDIVGSAYYVAPEVLHRSYSRIFRSVLRADPNFYDAPWPSVSAEAKDFVKRLLNRDHRKRMTAAQALALMKNALTDAMKESRFADILNMMEPLSYKKMDFEEFCAALSVLISLRLSKIGRILRVQHFRISNKEIVLLLSRNWHRELNLGPAAYSLLAD